MAEVAYRTIVPEIRASFHSKLGRALGQTAGANPEEVASHLERGGLAPEAARQYLEAATAASRRADSESVLRCTGAALRLGVSDVQARFALHMARADAHRFRGEHDEQGVDLEAALALAPTDTDRARVLTEEAARLGRSGRLEEAEDRAVLALDHARLGGDAEAQARALGRLGVSRLHRGLLDEASEVLAEATVLVDESMPHLQAQITEWRALLAGYRGDIGESTVRFQEATRLYSASGDERRAAANSGNLADAYNRIGAYPEAIAALEAALEGCRRVGNRSFEGFVLLNLAYARAAMGEHRATLTLLDQAQDMAERTGVSRIRECAPVYRARSLLALGQSDVAAQMALEAAALCEASGNVNWRVLALTVLVRAALVRDDLQVALESSELAMRLRDEIGGLEEDEAEVFLARADSLVAAGRDDEAQRVRRAGAERLNTIAEAIEEPAWRERFLSGPEAHRALLGAGAT